MKNRKLFKINSNGKDVADIQRKLIKLNFPITDSLGHFGENTEIFVKQFQQSRGLLVDGIVGDETWQNLVEASYVLGRRTLYIKQPYLRGDDVKIVQLWLRTLGFNPGPIDSTYGPLSEKAVKAFQLNYGLPVDGILSTDTIEAFTNLKTVLEKNASIEFPQRETRPDSSLAAIEDQRLIIDFGHGGDDPGEVGPTGLKESEVCEDIGMRVGNLFKMLGTNIKYTRRMNQSRSMESRVDFINNMKADLVISIHMNHAQNSSAEGSSTYYFALGDVISKEGKKIAGCVQEENVNTLDTKDCRVHGKNFNLLRLTKIPAVIIEPVFITNTHEEVLLKDEDFRQKIASSVFDGLQKFFRESPLNY